MALETRDYSGIEIFATGTWNGNKFTSKDLDNIVAAYQASKGIYSIPIKLGHNDKQSLLSDDMPAAGWVENIRRTGNKLLADFMKVPAKLGELIESGAYRKRSIELNTDFKIGESVFPLALTGIALLGAQLPAVESLEDIIGLYAKQDIDREDESRPFVFEAAEEPFEELLAALDRLSERAERVLKGRPGAPTLRQLHRAYREGLQRINKITHSNKENGNMEESKLRELLKIGEDDDIEEAIAKLQKSSVVDPKQAADDDTKTELKLAQERLLVLERDAATGRASSSVDKAIQEGKLLPAQRETALKMALRDQGEFEAFIATQPKVLDFGEKGSSSNTSNFAQYEPTASQLEAARMTGAETNDEWRKSMTRQNAQMSGVTIPDSYFVKKE